MKFSLLFLTCCMVATCFGQNMFYWPFSSYFGHHQQQPAAGWPVSQPSEARLMGGSFRPRGPFGGYYSNVDSSIDDSDYEDLSGEDGNEIVGRNKLRFRPGGFMQSKRRPFIGNQRFGFSNAMTSRYTTYTTTYSTTSTATTAVVKTCIPAAQFKVANPPTCRRKRQMPMILENAAISPSSNVDQVETTELDMAVVERSRRDLESSRDLQDNHDQPSVDRASPRFAFQLLNSLLGGGGTTTLTITIPTSYTFTTTTISSPVSLLASGTTSQLACLPSGFAVC